MVRALRPGLTPDAARAFGAVPAPPAAVAPVTVLSAGRPRHPHPDDVARQLDAALGVVALRVSERGTKSQAPILEAMSETANRASPGAAAALVDWNGTEVARLRAFGVVHGVVLDVLDPYDQAFLLGLFLGADLRLAG
jgi:hypothetical protein